MSSLTEQMARLIGNRLAGGETLFLPEVGSLYVAQHRARQLTKRTVRPPYKSVEFTSQEQGEALPDLIAKAAQCDVATARTVYDRWLAQVRPGEALTIEGVGELAHKHFTPTPEFDRRINPHGHAPVRVRRKGGFDWVLALGIAAILVALGIAGAYYYYNIPQPSVAESRIAAVAPAEEQELPIAETTEPETTDPAAAEQSAPVEQPVQEAQEATTSRTTEPADPEALTKPVSGRHYVVMGVFSTRENAEAARKHFAGQQPDWSFRIYLFGSKFLLACHSCETEMEARDFVRSHRNQFPDLWVHSAR